MGKHRKHRKGKGFGDFLGSTIAGIGEGLGKGVYNMASGLFGGGRRRRRRGGAEQKEEEETPSTLARLRKIAKDSKIISRTLNEFGNPYGIGAAVDTLGYGRRRRRGAAIVTGKHS